MKKNTTTASAKAKAPKRTPIDLPIEQLMIALASRIAERTETVTP